MKVSEAAMSVVPAVSTRVAQAAEQKEARHETCGFDSVRTRKHRWASQRNFHFIPRTPMCGSYRAYCVSFGFSCHSCALSQISQSQLAQRIQIRRSYEPRRKKVDSQMRRESAKSKRFFAFQIK